MKKLFWTMLFVWGWTHPILADDVPLIRGEIQNINEDGTINLNIGSNQGVTEGMIFDAYGNNKVYRLPLSQETYIEEGRVVGQIQVIKVNSRYCHGRQLKPFDVHVGQLVLGRPVPVKRGNRPPVIDHVTWDQITPQWGRPVMMRVEGHDDDNNPLSVSASCSQGHIVNKGGHQVLWYPPHKTGVSKVSFDLTDGIAHARSQVDIPYAEPSTPHYDAAAQILIGDERFSFDQIDQLVVAPDGNIWILDKSSNRLICLSPTLYERRIIELEDVKPLRFSVNSRHIAVLDSRNDRALIYDHTGQVLNRVGSSGHQVHEWAEPIDILLLPDDALAVLDAERQTVVMHDSKGRFVCCLGHPGSEAPGFTRATWLEREGQGFAVLDLGQRTRHLFDADWRYTKSLPLGDLVRPLTGPGQSRDFQFPEGFDNNSLMAIARGVNNNWLAVDRGGKRLWKIDDNKVARFVVWDPQDGDYRLKPGPLGGMYWINRETNTVRQIDYLGLSQSVTIPHDIEELSSCLVEDKLYVDVDRRRIFHGDNVYGQEGSSRGMLDEPDDVLRWGELTAIIDIDNETVMLFDHKGLLQHEESFDNCVSFALNSQNELVILCKGEQSWIWKTPVEKPQAFTLPEDGYLLRALPHGLAVASFNTLTLFDNQGVAKQTLKIREIADVGVSAFGLLWVVTEEGRISVHATAVPSN